MSLTPGTRLGPYEVTALIGRGGMGEVYRATDTNLKRPVALKVLPPSLADDAERLARFQREAEVLASLNHPHIAQIYGLEKSASGTALVMELVEGEDLSQRIARGAMALDEALPIARQIAEALEAAHEQGIVHRDLKPANVKVRPDGTVKVLDFGLAKALTPDAASTATSDIANSPTITSPAMTAMGMILGTAAYMSPEQAAGRLVDRRADIWAFGVVLWELLTGTPLFHGESTAHVLADVIRTQVDFTKLPPSTPPVVRTLLARCLDRDVKSRLQWIGEARVTLGEFAANPDRDAPRTVMAPRPSSSTARLIPWTLAGALACATAALGYVAYLNSAAPTPAVVRSFILPPAGSQLSTTSPPALSPDGRRLAFVATKGGTRLLWVRELDTVEARSLNGTDGASAPFWSPDGGSVAFFSNGALKRVDVAGGPVRKLCDAQPNTPGTWSPRGIIVFPMSNSTGLFRVPDTGGTPVPATTLDSDAGELSHRLPWFLPDGRHFLYQSRHRDEWDQSVVYVGDLDSGERRELLKGAAHAVYVTETAFPASGFLLTARVVTGAFASPLTAQRMNPVTFQLSGDPVQVAESVGASSGIFVQRQMAVSATGVLVYMAGDAIGRERLTWFDKAGRVLGQLDPAIALRVPAISPDGHTLAADYVQGGSRDLWLYDISRGTSSRFTHYTNAGTQASYPAWAPDGQSLMYVVSRGMEGSFTTRRLLGASSTEPRTAAWTTPPRDTRFLDWSRDGRYLVATMRAATGGTGWDVWMQRLLPTLEAPRPYLQSEADEDRPRLSPSGQWIAYTSDETRNSVEVYVQSFPEPGRRYRVSLSGGTAPVWSRDGSELYFVAPDQLMMAAPVRMSGNTLDIGTPRPLFDSKMIPTGVNGFDVTKDRRFLVPARDSDREIALTLVVNWQAGLAGN